MDASILRGKDAAVVCENCGYSRRGLPLDGSCPECGGPPPVSVRSAAGLPTLTLTQQGQIRLVTIGLLLLLYASYYSMQLAVTMNYEQLSLHAINLPSPKLAAVTLVQREIGGRPGPWGTMGWSCVLFQLIAIYMITVPTIRSTANEGWLSLRRLTRWTSLISISALMGFMLSHGQGYIPMLSWYTWDLLLYTLVLGEIPSNLLLYSYLSRIAKQYRMERVARTLKNLAWIGLGVRLVCVMVMVYPFAPNPLRDAHQAFALAALACFAIPAGVIGWVAMINLTIRSARLGFTKPLRRSMALVKDRAPVIRTFLRWIEKNIARICVTTGLVLWMLASADQFAMAINNTRQGLGGELPMLNYVGPKIAAAWMSSPGYYSWRYAEGVYVEVSWMVLITFLITVAIPGLTPADHRFRRAVRWGLLIAIGLRFGVLLMMNATMKQSYINVAHSFLLEAPATAIVMVYLARIAKFHLLFDLKKRLLQLAVLSSMMILIPLMLHYFSKYTWAFHRSWQMGLIGSAYCIASMVLGVCGFRWIGFLTWQIARPVWDKPSPATPFMDIENRSHKTARVHEETPTGEPIGVS